MKNQQTTQKAKQKLTKLILISLAIIMAIGGIITFSVNPNSRPSTTEEIKAQEQFQKKLVAAQKEAQQKIDTAAKEAE